MRATPNRREWESIMEEPTNTADQAQTQDHEKRSYENSPWINVYDWQVTQFENHQTGEPFWDIKLASQTFVRKDGERIDVSNHHFTTNYPPAITHGEPGTPHCTRGIHFPEDWEITLKRFENIAQDGQEPNFVEVSRVEGVTPKELSEGIHERAKAWRSAHRQDEQHQTAKRDNQEQTQGNGRSGRAERGNYPDRQRPTEPSL